MSTSSASAAPDEPGLVLGGRQLGVTELGAAMDEAVGAVTAELGPAEEDPASVVSCIGSEREVRWDGFVLAERDGRLAGWSSTSTAIGTPSGVRRGTRLQRLEEIYGDGYTRSPANPDNPPTFAVDGVDVAGELSSAADDAVVTRLFSRFCSGP